MNKHRLPVLLAMMLFVAPATRAADIRLFVPVMVTNLNGAGGSVWRVDFWVTNTSSQPIVYALAPCTFAAECDLLNTMFPQSTSGRGDSTERPSGRWVLSVPALQFEARLRDVSRNASSAGIELPIVQESDFRSDEINLNGIPRDARFRLTLRVYGLDAGGDVTVEQIDANGHLLRTIDATLMPPAEPHLLAGYAQLALDTGSDDFYPMRLRIRPRTAGLRIWALASLTNNVTSEVTLVQPWRGNAAAATSVTGR